LIIGSIIIPVLNEESNIAGVLQPLQSLRDEGWLIIVVDGGSSDATVEYAKPLASTLLVSNPGRAIQMNAGAARAEGEVLVFLHADTVLPAQFASEMVAFNASNKQWGRFDVTLSGSQWMFSVIAWFINWRSRLTGIATGDQALFFKRAYFDQLKGFAEIPLMEDVEICKRSKRQRFEAFCSPYRVITSSRKWELNGTWRTIWLMWRIRYAYYKGAEPKDLHRSYYL